MRTCSAPECSRRHYARGWCAKHYGWERRHGLTPLPRTTLIERVMAKVDKSGPVPAGAPHLGPCWIWFGHLNRTGYGQVNRGAKEGRALVHRVLYEHHVGPVPQGLELDHLCSVRACCNPTHLEPVTHAENVRRGRSAESVRERAAKRTHCNNGHPYTGDNFRITKDGRRRCRVCNREWARQNKTKRSAASVIDGSWPLIPRQPGGDGS